MKLGADAEFLLEPRPCFAEAGFAAELVSSVALVQELDDRGIPVGWFREGLDHLRDRVSYGQRLEHVSFGEEAEAPRVAVVMGEADSRGCAVSQSDLAAEQQEKAQEWLGRCQQSVAFVVGGDYAAGWWLVELGDGVADGFRRCARFFEPAEEAPETLRVGGFGVRREFGPRRCRCLDFGGVEAGWCPAALLRDEGTEGRRDVGIVFLRLLELRRGSRNCAGRGLGFAVERMRF